jgi:hypothetical protein
MAGTGCHSVLSPASQLSPAFLSRNRASTLRGGTCGPGKGEFSFSARAYSFFVMGGKFGEFCIITTLLYSAAGTQNYAHSSSCVTNEWPL